MFLTHSQCEITFFGVKRKFDLSIIIRKHNILVDGGGGSSLSPRNSKSNCYSKDIGGFREIFFKAIYSKVFVESYVELGCVFSQVDHIAKGGKLQ